MSPNTWIPHEEWNERYVEPHSDALALRGARTRILYSEDGQCIELTGNALWQHPWFTEARWDGERWVATVQPGFVNGQDPAVPGHPDLIDRPEIPLNSFRAIPSEGERIPPFFKALGVLDPGDDVVIDSSGNITFKTPAAPLQPPRALVAMDFYITVARATYQGNVDIVDVSGVAGQVADYSVTFNADNLLRVGARPRLMQSAKFPAVRVPTLAERLLGQFQDDGEDRILISTVYLLSPPDKLDGPPDETWIPFVQHGQFWNLCHRGRNVPPAKPAAPIRLYTGLLGGWADVIFNQLLVPGNELADTITNAVNTTTNAGRFWTA